MGGAFLIFLSGYKLFHFLGGPEKFSAFYTYVEETMNWIKDGLDKSMMHYENVYNVLPSFFLENEINVGVGDLVFILSCAAVLLDLF